MSASAQFAFVTLVTTDHYLPGALVVAAALRDVHPSPPHSAEELDPSEFHIVCLVTPESLDVSTIKLLRKAFDVVIGVELIEEDTEAGLKLLGRLDLKTVLTKLHIFRLTSYQKLIFLDADMLPLRPLSHLLRISADFAAVPDVGWPDIFNSGFLVLSPAAEKFDEVMSVMRSKGSWDGGDQGVLNEWRGSEWERLSFTYNTTPTAIYTYAPAYKRFGSQISNIHFIGPDKPWKQIPFRPPFTSSTDAALSSQTSKDFAPPPSYAYPALLDRWFAVYDKHYRCPPVPPAPMTIMASPPFAAAGAADSTGEPLSQRYESVWTSNMRLEGGAEASTAPLGLEELRRLTIEGSGDTRATGDEGVYRTLPLEGRVDLMRPKKQMPSPLPEEPGPATRSTPIFKLQVSGEPQTPPRSHSPAPMTTLPTPGPNELPPTPVLRGHSLPPETPTYAGHHQPQLRGISSLRTASATGSTMLHHRGRPVSPPLISWNPAVEAPPVTAPAASHFPEQPHFSNVWDAPTKTHHILEDSGFFPLPPPSIIPEQLIREGHYEAVIGHSPTKDRKHHPLPSERDREHSPVQQQQQQDMPHQDRQPTPPPHPRPDRSKIVNVFPWEELPRPRPQRFFPPTDSPPPGFSFTQPQPPVLKLDAPAQRPPSATSPPPPVIGFPHTTTYSNVWDSVPSIQRYASLLVKPAPAPSLPISGLTMGVRRTRKGSAATASGDYRTWQDRVEASSRDADDEDEGDDDERSPPSVGAASDHSDGPEEPLNKKYGSKGVQTIPREIRHQAVQVPNGRHAARPRNVPVRAAKDKLPESVSPPPPRSRRGPLHDTALPEQMHTVRSDVTAPGSTLPRDASQDKVYIPDDNLQLPSGSLSPRLHDAHTLGSVPRRSETSPVIASQATVHTVPELSPHLPTVSVDSAFVSVQGPPTASPLGPSSPPEGSPVLQRPPAMRRPVERTFDPAREVEVFKRGSEEVLARFLKMDSWVQDKVPGQSPSSIV